MCYSNCPYEVTGQHPENNGDCNYKKGLLDRRKNPMAHCYEKPEEEAEEPVEKVKRTWVYIMAPSAYAIAPCSCGNKDTQWSEYEGHLWCEKCQKDFVPEHNGIFDGPIPTSAAALMGISFARRQV